MQDVCRWLKMRQLDELLAPFVWHKVEGLSLRGLYSERSANTVEILRSFGVEQGGIALKLHAHLANLFDPK